MAEEKEYNKGTGGAVEDVKVRIEARVQAAVDEAMMRYEEERPEIAEPENWWNLWAWGPYQPPGTLRPHRVIRVGEPFYIFTILWLNPWWPQQVSSCELLTNMCGRFEIKYCTGDVCKWVRGPNELNVIHEIDMIPNQCWYVDFVYVPEAQPGWESCYEMSICARVLGCKDKPGASLPFAGFASAVRNIDWDIFYPAPPTPLPTPWPGLGPHWEWSIPIKFMIYS